LASIDLFFSAMRWCRRRTAMWRPILLFGILISLPALGFCDTVNFTVNPATIGVPIQGVGSFDLYSAGLNGVVLNGQNESWNLTFSNQVLARLFLSDPTSFGIGLEIHTSAGTFPGFAGPTTGYLLNPSGFQFGDSQSAGRADGSDGTFDMGLVSFTTSGLEGATNLDIRGVHFNTTLPNDGAVITDAQLRFSLNSPHDAVEFGAAKQLPEPSTLLLTMVGMLGIALGLRRENRKLLSQLTRRGKAANIFSHSVK